MLYKQIILATLTALPFALSAKDGQATLQQLQEGNSRYIKGETKHPNLVKEAQNYTVNTQEPVAVIVGCSDSRVPPEIIFDQGIGELFVVRVAGNVIGPIEMDSVEFAVAKLHTPLVIVLGHQNCGAVQAALGGQKNVPELESIYPLIAEAFQGCDLKSSEALQHAIECNVKNGVKALKASPTIAPLLAQNKVKIVGAYYEIGTSRISIIDN